MSFEQLRHFLILGDLLNSSSPPKLETHSALLFDLHEPIKWPDFPHFLQKLFISQNNWAAIIFSCFDRKLGLLNIDPLTLLIPCKAICCKVSDNSHKCFCFFVIVFCCSITLYFLVQADPFPFSCNHILLLTSLDSPT